MCTQQQDLGEPTLKSSWSDLNFGGHWSPGHGQLYIFLYAMDCANIHVSCLSLPKCLWFKHNPSLYQRKIVSGVVEVQHQPSSKRLSFYILHLSRIRRDEWFRLLIVSSQALSKPRTFSFRGDTWIIHLRATSPACKWRQYRAARNDGEWHSNQSDSNVWTFCTNENAPWDFSQALWKNELFPTCLLLSSPCLAIRYTVFPFIFALPLFSLFRGFYVQREN